MKFKQFAHKNAMNDMDTVKSLANADAKLATMEKIAINATHIQAASMAIVDAPGNATASE